MCEKSKFQMLKLMTAKAPEIGEGSPKMKRSICASYDSTESIYIADPETVKQKIAKIRADGPDNLNLISDFDFTLTRRNYDGVPADSTFKVLASSPLLREEFREHSKRLYEKYSPIERDMQMPTEVRAGYMLEWWQKSLDLVISERLSLKKIKDSVMLSDLYFRFGIRQVMEVLRRSSVHSYIVSAGLRPVISQAFSVFEGQTGLSLAGAYSVCSTQEQYGEDDCITGFLSPFITCANKFLLFTHDRFPAIKPFSNAIVMGDLIDDLSMISSLKLSTTLTIGMLNSDDAVSLEDYKKAFDIVIGVDGNLIHVAQILEEVCSSKYNDYNSYGANAELISRILLWLFGQKIVCASHG